MTYIISIETEVPENETEQTQIMEFMNTVYPSAIHEKISKLYLRSGIQKRYSCVSDYSLDSKRELYPDSKDLELFPEIEKRLEIYNKKALPLALKTIEKNLKTVDKNKITHLITVSCTGMYAPGLDLQLAEALELKDDIYRTSINFMGCYAAFHGLKHADYICQADPKAVVLVVCLELCTLHFMKDLDMNCITANAIFGDGCASVVMTQNKELVTEKSLKIEGFYSKVLFSGKHEMAWGITKTAFKMVLTEAIPELIKDNIQEVIEDCLKSMNYELKDINKWAVHPGGRKILDYFQKAMNFTSDELINSYNVLSNYGNMSSPTVLFVLKDLIDNMNFEEKNKIFSCAFGPGITVETMLLSN